MEVGLRSDYGNEDLGLKKDNNQGADVLIIHRDWNKE